MKTLVIVGSNIEVWNWPTAPVCSLSEEQREWRESYDELMKILVQRQESFND
jgi:hypothetical protein